MNCFLAAIQNPPSDTSAAAGSTLWQLVFISFACVLILLEVLRGWRRGLPRQLARLGALICAYFIAYFCGSLFAPLLRPFLKMPNAALAVIASAGLAIVVYLAINMLGTILFRRTGQHESMVVRMLYGSTGAILGIFFGAFLVWMIVVGIRSLGAIADAQVRQNGAASGRPLHAVDARRQAGGAAGEEPTTLMTTLSRLKNSIELGSVGAMVRKSDPVPERTYDTLGKVGRVVSDPERVQKFLSFPGAKDLSEHPKIVALRDDPEISDLIAQGRYMDLLQNQKILDAANDPELNQEVKEFNLQGALDYALKKE